MVEMAIEVGGSVLMTFLGPKINMTVLFSSNSQVELLGFINRHCAVAFRRPKIIADQNGVSTHPKILYI